MKRGINGLFVLLVLIYSALILPKQTTAQNNNISFQVFYDELSPYGQWIDYRNYGYVWIPDTGPNFAPYSTDGHWILTDYGWTWISDYEWGWAPFHYGRWDYDNYYGWFWVPDNEWGPSWVNWRRADGYYGWSPMQPGISLSRNFGRPYNRYNDHWMFVRDRDFERNDLNSYYIDRRDHYLIIRKSTVINTTYIDNSRHTTYVTGPAREEVQRVTGRRINPVTIRENNRPGQNLKNGQLEIYRPQVVKNNNQHKAVPSLVADIKDVKRPSERTGTNQHRTSTPEGNKGRQLQQQGNTARPQNDIQPVKQRTATPSDYNTGRQQQQRNTARPQNDIQPVKQRTATPSENNTGRQQQQRNTARPQNNVQPAQQGTATPSDNNTGRQQQQQRNTARPQNDVQPAQPRREFPSDNNTGRQQQQQRNTARPQNDVQPAQPRTETPSDNNIGRQQQQQQNTANPQGGRNEQPGESRSGQNKKRND